LYPEDTGVNKPWLSHVRAVCRTQELGFSVSLSVPQSCCFEHDSLGSR